ITESYGFLRDTSWMKNLASNIGNFDSTLLGFINLKRAALVNGVIYWPAMALVFGSALAQFFQSRQLMPKSDDSRKLRQILKDASNGKNSDNSEVNASIMKTTQYFIPFMIFFFTVRLPSALSLYWLVSGVTAYIQQAKILKQDENDMQAIANKSGSKVVIEGEVVPKKAKPKTKTKPAKKRRKK
ncbi:MAG: YidC/Oxa1 family membrane protein insertase, partial [Candidatus Saccharibacteria bacterium]